MLVIKSSKAGLIGDCVRLIKKEKCRKAPSKPTIPLVTLLPFSSILRADSGSKTGDGLELAIHWVKYETKSDLR